MAKNELLQVPRTASSRLIISFPRVKSFIATKSLGWTCRVLRAVITDFDNKGIINFVSLFVESSVKCIAIASAFETQYLSVTCKTFNQLEGICHYLLKSYVVDDALWLQVHYYCSITTESVNCGEHSERSVDLRPSGDLELVSFCYSTGTVYQNEGCVRKAFSILIIGS